MKQKTLFSRVAKALCLAFMFTVVGISTLTGAFGTAFASNAPLVDKSQVEVPSEDEYAYSIMVMGDPQYMTICDYQNGTNYTDRYYSWIAENASKLKTKFLVGVGDIVHNDTEREFRDVVKPALAKFDTVGLPYALVRGNHDNRAYWYDKYIGGESQYMKQDTIVSYYANPDDDERLYSTKARNTAHEYIVGETKYLVICLDFGAQDPVLEWANSVVGDSKYANHNVFVTTHGYMSGEAEYLDGIDGTSPSRYDESYDNPEKTVTNPFIDKSLGERVTYKYNAKVNPDESFNDGDDIWDKFVRKHANIKAVFCGHVYAEEIVYAKHVGDHGNVVQEIVINPQVWDDDGKDDGAAGYADSLTGTIAILYCSEDGQTIAVRNYSVLKDKYLGETSQQDWRLGAREWNEGEGMAFNKDTLYTMKSAVTKLPRTVEINMNYDVPSGNQMVVSSYGSNSVSQFAVRVLNGTGNLGVYYRANTGTAKDISFEFTDIVPNDDTKTNYAGDGLYHHYAVTLEGDKAHCYVDGVLAQTVTYASGKEWTNYLDGYNGLPFAVGGDLRNGNGGYFSAGTVKSVVMTADVRTAQEIAFDYKFAPTQDSDLILAVDFANAIANTIKFDNYGDQDNPLIVARTKFSTGEGMSFTKDKLYSLAKPLSAFPKTIEVYMKSAVPSGNKVVLGNYSASGDYGTQMTLRIKGSTGQLGIFYNGENFSVTFDTTVDGNYHLYSITMDGTNASLYVDGALKETKTIPVLGGGTNANDPNRWVFDKFNGLPWCIGGDNRSGNSGYFTGSIKYVTMYADVRTASEISAMASSGTFSYDEDALVAVDMAKAVNGGHITNHADSTNILYAPGKTFTKSVVNSVASVFASAPYSTEAVIRGTGANQWIVGNYIDWGNKNTWYGIKYLTDNKISVSICGSGWSSSGATFDTVIPTNRYVHIAVVLDGTKAYLYVDGKLSDTKDFVLNAVWATKWRSSMPMVIGGDNRSGNAQALTSATIQSVAIYSTIRTAEDIEKSYAYGIDPNASGLMAGYEFGGFNDKTVYQNLNKNGAVLVASNHNFKANETYLDIADYGVNADGYVWGQEQTSSQSYRGATYKLWDYSVKGDTNPNIGFEFRYKSVDTKAQIAATMSAQNYKSALYMFTNVRLGHSFFDISLPNDLSYLSIRSGHFRNTETSSTAKTMMFYEDPSPVNLIAFEDNAEYIFRFTRTAIDASVDNGYGALLCVYVGKINPTTNMPEEGWDTTPKYTHLALYERNSTQTNECGISVEPGWINNNSAMPHTLIISSNKYCGVKVDGVMSKHVRGTEFTFADDSDKTDNIFLIGYSAGATTYSADDFASAGGKKVINKSTEFKSLSVTLHADEFASARFRNRVVSGKVQPLELALNWGANATFTNGLDTYFSVKFGYALTASNGATSGDIEVSKVVDNAFSVTQSNIGENFYDLKFSFRAYVEINGTKYYTAKIDANDGDSVSAIASELVSELASESTANKTNAIKDSEGNVIGYHYLTQSQYDLANQIAQA